MKFSDPRVQRLLDLVRADWTDPFPGLYCVKRGGECDQLPAVYVFVRSEVDDDVMYVGQTKELRRRLYAHENNPRMASKDWSFVHYVSPVTSETARLSVETALIALLKPPLNKAVSIVRSKERGWRPLNIRTRV